jgi:hypothetical protein
VGTGFGISAIDRAIKAEKNAKKMMILVMDVIL